VVARNHQSSKEIKEQFPFIETLDLEHFIRKTIKGDIIINTTPVGMFPNVKECPIPKDVFKYFTVAIDIVYNPLITRFLTLAKSQHLEIVTGLSMLICQAIGAQEIWLDRKIDYKLAKDIENKLRIE
jgi:shikimate dehydrogenase